MTSERKIRANRANARASTGPKSARGRANSSKNAFRHGLSLPIHSDPTLFGEVEAIASAIAGPGAEPQIKEVAYRIAEAQTDLRRVRSARHQFLSAVLSSPHKYLAIDCNELPLHPDSVDARPHDLASTMIHCVMSPKEQRLHDFALVISQQAKQLKMFERYESRAMFRRNAAIRSLFLVEHCLPYIQCVWRSRTKPNN
jgi:hypothetical protein